MVAADTCKPSLQEGFDQGARNWGDAKDDRADVCPYRTARSSDCPTAVLQARPGAAIDAAAVTAFVKHPIGSVKTPKQIELWNDLPRSRIGKVLKAEVRAKLMSQ
jgi:acyl-CoA synthetase (AMP-forming)/AMP-acid ligase II